VTVLLISAEKVSAVINVPRYTKLLIRSKDVCFTLKTFSTYFFLVLNIIRANKSGNMRWTRHVAHIGMMRNSYIYFSCSTTGKCYIVKNNIKMDVKEAVCEVVEELAFLSLRFGGCIKGGNSLTS
jgi:hypothetical protein